MALLTTEDVLNKTFNIVKFREGYDQVEVDDFLDEVVSTIYTLQAENQNLREELEAAERRVAELSNGQATTFTAPEEPEPVVEEAPAPAASVTETVVAAPVAPATPESAESATSMLALAQRVHDEYVRDGREESDRIIADANAKRDEIIADAQNQHQNILSQLDQERSLLEGKINELRSFEAEYRANLRDHLAGLLKEVNAGTQN